MLLEVILELKLAIYDNIIIRSSQEAANVSFNKIRCFFLHCFSVYQFEILDQTNSYRE